MKLINNFKFDIKDIYGDIVIVYPEGSVEAVADLRERLEASGYSYHCRPIGKTVFGRETVDGIIALLDRCNCFVPVVTKALSQPENALCRSVLWYLIGYMRSASQGSTVPFIPDGEDSGLLKGTPIQTLDFVSDTDAFMKTLNNRFSSRLLRKNYYENASVNSYASRRIVYHCLRLRFNIWEEAFRNAMALYRDYTSRSVSEDAFDAYIEKYVTCGCKVVSFGNPYGLTPQMAVYRDEVTPKIEDYTDSIAGKRFYRRNSAEKIAQTGIRGELGVDVVIPVHKLLGAFVKCYLECEDVDADVTVLLSLMEGDFVEEISECDLDLLDDMDYWKKSYPEGTYINRKRGRFYFDLGIERRSDSLVPDPSLEIGERLDFIFSQ